MRQIIICVQQPDRKSQVADSAFKLTFYLSHSIWLKKNLVVLNAHKKEKLNLTLGRWASIIALLALCLQTDV